MLRPGSPKKPGSHRTEMIRCSELDKEEARGWLIADAVGRPLLHRNDDRSQNDARDVGKRVLERSGKAAKDIATAKEKAAAAVRTATRAAAKDSSLQQRVADAEQAGAKAVAAACSAAIDLDIPAATGYAERPASYWRRREVQEADAAAAEAAAEAAVACTVKEGAEARVKRASQALRQPNAADGATDRYLEIAKAHGVIRATAREAARAAEAKAVEAAAVRAAAVSEGVDVRPGGWRKRKREDEKLALATVEAAAEDMITAIVNYYHAEPHYISLERWHFLECEVRWAREECPGCCEEKAVRMRRRWLNNFEADARACEMECRHIAWRQETIEEPAVMELVHRLEAGEDPAADIALPDSDLDDEQFAAAMELYDSKQAALAGPMLRADFRIGQRIYSRMPWERALRMRQQDYGDTRPWFLPGYDHAG